MKCLKCGEENLDNAIYCKKCGNRLDGNIVCPGCGKLTPSDSKFCINCGIDLTQPIIKKKKILKKKRKS